MPDQILYLTNRYASPYFAKWLRSCFETHGVELDLRSLGEKVDPSPYIGVITESLDCNTALHDATLMPFNETQAPVGERWSKSRAMIAYFVVTSHTYRQILSERDIEPSLITNSPLVQLPERPDEIDEQHRPLKFFVPIYHGWSQEEIESLTLLMANAVSRDIPDMDLVEFVVESAPFDYKPIAGERVSFTSESGEHVWKLMDSRVVCCLGNMYNMEMTFLRSLRNRYRLPIADFYECLVGPGFGGRAILSSLAQNKAYSEIKRGLVTKDWFFSRAYGNRPLFDYTTGLKGVSTVGSMELSIAELMELLKPRIKLDKVDEGKLIEEQVDQKKIFDAKMGSLCNLLKRAKES